MAFTLLETDCGERSTGFCRWAILKTCPQQTALVLMAGSCHCRALAGLDAKLKESTVVQAISDKDGYYFRLMTGLRLAGESKGG